MEAMNYTSIGPVLQLNKAGELTQKRMKAVKVCDGLYISEPDKNGYMQFICELNDVIWLDCKAAETKIAYGIKRIPSYFKDIKAGCFDGKNIEKFRREISRRINHPDSPAIMELKKPERKKPAPLAENERKVSVLMLKGCTDEMTEKKVVIAEVASHVYTYTYKLKRYGERVKIIFEIDGVYFQGHDTGAYVLEREDFTEVCVKAYEHARDNVADGAANGTTYFLEVQKRIDAATPSETPQISTETAETVNVSAEGENEPQAAKYKPYTTRAEIIALLESEHGIEYDAGEVVYLKDGCVAEDLSDEGEWRIYLDADSDKCIDVIAIQPPQSPENRPTAADVPKAVGEYNAMYRAKYAERCPQMLAYLPTEPRETVNVSVEGENAAEGAIYAFISKAETTLNKIKQKCINGEIYVEDASRYEFMACMAVSNFVNKHKDCPTEPPHSPETPQAGECSTNTTKPRETARKRLNRAIGSAQEARRDTLRDTLRLVTHVPRECSTVDAAHW